MKKSVLYVLAMLFAFSSCSSNEEINNTFFEECDLTVFYQDVPKSETFKLLEALLDHLSENLWQPGSPSPISSYFPTFFPTEVNDYLLNNKEAVALFNREDCVSILLSTYLTGIKTNEYLMLDIPNCIGCTFVKCKLYFYLEWVLSSEMFLSKMNVTEKVQLMELTLERIKYEERSPYPFSIQISIMLSSNYTPFVENVKPMLHTVIGNVGYTLRTNDGLPISISDANNLISGYARQFINDNK